MYLKRYPPTPPGTKLYLRRTLFSDSVTKHIKTLQVFLSFVTHLYKYPTLVYNANLSTAYLTYGGHVSDSADLEAVEAVCRVCLQPLPSTSGSGPHILSEMISMKGHFGM